MGLKDARLGLIQNNRVDGIPLDLTSSLLPISSKFSPGLAMHLHMHAAMCGKHAETGQKAKQARQTVVNSQQLKDIVFSLRDTVAKLQPGNRKTEWANYYEDTNYTTAARKEKEAIITKIAQENGGELAVDLGANTGEFSRLISPYFKLVIATDIDYGAVEIHWVERRSSNILPLVLDLANPTPAIGWNNTERQSFKQRCKANFICALALIHHLRITAGIPLAEVVKCFSDLLNKNGIVVIEFVPKSDSQVIRLLSRRDDIFSDYSEEECLKLFAESGFNIIGCYKIAETERTIYVFRK